ncbi:biotin/lipoyl-containing protein [Bacillus sp. N9]
MMCYERNVFKRVNIRQIFYEGEGRMAEIVATMAGTILDVLMDEGDQVVVGQTVAILESMKMEIPIESPNAGTITEVKVAEGNFVNEGDALFILK